MDEPGAPTSSTHPALPRKVERSHHFVTSGLHSHVARGRAGPDSEVQVQIAGSPPGFSRCDSLPARMAQVRFAVFSRTAGRKPPASCALLFGSPLALHDRLRSILRRGSVRVVMLVRLA